MSKDGFTSGLIVGAAIGGLVGGVLGVLLASRRSEENATDILEAKMSKGKQRPLDSERMEVARLSLEDKIAQLNEAIDDVRLQLDNVNGNLSIDHSEPSLAEDL